MHAPRVNETSIILGNVVIIKLFLLGGEKESKYN